MKKKKKKKLKVPEPLRKAGGMDRAKGEVAGRWGKQRPNASEKEKLVNIQGSMQQQQQTAIFASLTFRLSAFWVYPLFSYEKTHFSQHVIWWGPHNVNSLVSCSSSSCSSCVSRSISLCSRVSAAIKSKPAAAAVPREQPRLIGRGVYYWRARSSQPFSSQPLSPPGRRYQYGDAHAHTFWWVGGWEGCYCCCCCWCWWWSWYPTYPVPYFLTYPARQPACVFYGPGQQSARASADRETAVAYTHVVLIISLVHPPIIAWWCFDWVQKFGCQASSSVPSLVRRETFDPSITLPFWDLIRGRKFHRAETDRRSYYSARPGLMSFNVSGGSRMSMNYCALGDP